MKNKESKYAVITGVSIILLAIVARVVYGVVHTNLQETPTNQLNQLFSVHHVEILLWLLVIMLDIVILWALFIFLKPINEQTAYLVMLTRLVYTVLLCVAVVPLVLISMYPETTTSTQFDIHINAFELIWSFALVIFGLHLITIGFMFFKQSTLPTWVGILLLLGGLSYVIVESTSLVVHSADLQLLEQVLMLPMVLGELLLGVWLIYYGIKSKNL